MNNEQLIRKLIRSSIQRAIVETVAAIVVWVAFARLLQQAEVGSAMHYGCLVILVATGFIVGVVWSYALSFRLLRLNPAGDVSFWREAFHVQAKLLRMVPLWYCAPLCAGAILFFAPAAAAEFTVFAGVIWLNRRAARCIEQQAARLVAG